MNFKEITFNSLLARTRDLRTAWSSKQPFRYLIVDDFLPIDFAQAIFSAYPAPAADVWDRTTYVHQRNKLTKRSGFPEPIACFFEMTSSEEFRGLISEICGISDLVDDPELIGGGLHQSLRGGFLDVHVDYNLHPVTKLYRRLNLLLYMNKDWQPEYGGYLELWDLAENRKLEEVAPTFNRAVLFETNEISYHGHPRPLLVPDGTTRKSLAIYYYTKSPASSAVAPEHNTIYKQTTGVQGYAKTLISTARALQERVGEQNAGALGRDLLKRLERRLKGLPPENR